MQRGARQGFQTHYQGFQRVQEFQYFQESTSVEPEEDQYKQLITSGKSLSKVLLMDSGSTCHTTCNKDFVVDIGPADKPCQLNTNNATSVMNVQATVPGLGKTYFDENHRANIMSLSKTTDDNFVQMQSWKKNAFQVQQKKYGKNG